MTKLTLTIEGDATAIARVLAAIDPEAPVPGNAPSTSTGGGTPVAPVSPPNAPSSAAPTPSAPSLPTPPTSTTSPDDDDEGDDGPAAPDAPETDSAGLRWDERIHAGNKATKADGTWKRRRNVSDELVAQVEQELRGGAAPPPPAATTPTAPMPAPVAAPAPAPAPVPQPIAAPTPPPAPVDPATIDFPGFLGKLSELGTSGKVDTDYLTDLTQRAAAAWQRPLQSLTDLGTNPDMIPWVVQTMINEQRW